MNKYPSILLLCFSLFGCAYNHLSVCDEFTKESIISKEVWCKEIKLKGWETAEGAVFSKNNNIFIAGSSQRPGLYGVSSEALLLSLSEYGEKKWINTFTFHFDNPDNGETTANGLALLNNGKLILTGRTRDENGIHEGWIALFEPSGDIVSKLTTAGGRWFEDITVTNGSDFVAVGALQAGGIITKYSDSFHILWSMEFPPIRWSSVAITKEGEIVVAGNDSLKGLVVMSLSSSGKKQWRKFYGKTSVDGAQIIKEAPKGTFIISAQTEDRKLWLLNINSKGEVLWENKRGVDAWPNDLLSIENYGYIVCAVELEKKRRVRKSNAWVVHFNENGKMLASKYYGGTGASSCRSIAGTPEKLFITGQTIDTSVKSRNFAWGNESFSTLWVIRENANSE